MAHLLTHGDISDTRFTVHHVSLTGAYDAEEVEAFAEDAKLTIRTLWNYITKHDGFADAVLADIKPSTSKEN